MDELSPGNMSLTYMNHVLYTYLMNSQQIFMYFKWFKLFWHLCYIEDRISFLPNFCRILRTMRLAYTEVSFAWQKVGNEQHRRILFFFSTATLSPSHTGHLSLLLLSAGDSFPSAVHMATNLQQLASTGTNISPFPRLTNNCNVQQSYMGELVII